MLRSCSVATLLCATVLAGCLPEDSAASGEGWTDTAVTFRGATGARHSQGCAPGGPLGAVWGTDIYTDDSSICTAAVHAGLIDRAIGGTVVFEILPGQSSYAGSTRYGVTSMSFGAWPGSFGIREATPGTPPPSGMDAGPGTGPCRYPAVDCPPIGCVSGGPYCCRVGTMANSCFETYDEAERLCASMIYMCGAGPPDDGCPDGYVLVSWDDEPAVCSQICTSDYDCASRSCQGTSIGGTSACAPASGPCDPPCGSDQICVTFSDGSASCGARCSSNGECGSSCCGTLDDGSRACVPSRFCSPGCTPSCAGRACGEDDGCGGTCDGYCDRPELTCVTHLSDPSVRYCSQLCSTATDCCAGSMVGAVRNGNWCCIPGSMTSSGRDTCGWSATYTCAWYSEDICIGRY